MANGVVYVGGDCETLYALNAGTGALLWATASDSRPQSAPAVANGVVYVSTLAIVAKLGGCGRWNASTGAFLWFYAAYCTGGGCATWMQIPRPPWPMG